MEVEVKGTISSARTILTALMAVGLLFATATAAVTTTYTQTNLVADIPGFVPAPLNIDPNLLNGWGLAMDPAGDLAVAANHSGMDIFYDNTGAATLPAIQIPAVDGSFPGAPSGQVYNPTNWFVIPGTTDPAKFIFSTEDGILCAWASGPSATIVVNPLDDGSVYKGLAMAMLGGKPYLYATNFGDHRIDVFDGNWNVVAKFPFVDADIPDNYSPFGIANLDNKLWVTYAIPKPPDFMDNTAGPGHGIVDIYNPNGTLVRRFYSYGVLNSPWGITMAPAGSGPQEKVILIGNFGDGMVNAFRNSGEFLNALVTPDGDPITISGLWALMGMTGRDANRVYFTAGPNGETDGLFGYLEAQFPQHGRPPR